MTTAGSCASFLYATDGQPCGFKAGTPGTYTLCIGGSGGATCWIPTGMNAGTCKVDGLEGTPCDIANGPGCIVPARCIITGGGTAGTCRIADATMCS
jgi:hypothetical protein